MKMHRIITYIPSFLMIALGLILTIIGVNMRVDLVVASTFAMILGGYVIYYCPFFDNNADNTIENNYLAGGRIFDPQHFDPQYPDLDDMPHDLGDRMKYYERKSETLVGVPAWKPFILRLDIRACSKLLKRLKNALWREQDEQQIPIAERKPYSEAFSKAMIETAKDLLLEFGCSTAYTHSDEITLIFPPACSKEDFDSDIDNRGQHPFGGKQFKLITLTASYASVRFTQNFGYALASGTNAEQNLFDQIYKSTKGPTFTFDSRLIVFPQTHAYEIVNHMIWRSKMDCFRNFVSMYAEKYFTAKQLSKKSVQDRLDMLHEKGVDVPIDNDMANGAYVKRYTTNEIIPATDTETEKVVIHRNTGVIHLPDIKCNNEIREYLYLKSDDVAISARNYRRLSDTKSEV